MCRNAKIPAKKKLQQFLGNGFEIPDYNECDNANSFDHPDVPVITNLNPTKVELASWGLVPEWVRDMETAIKMANACRNAKAETLFELPSFKPSIRTKRCLIFIDGIHEWQHLDPKGKKKQQYYVDMKNAMPFATAGLWTNWGDHKTCVMITTDANPLMAEIHNSKQRQPLILDKDKWAEWLDTAISDDEIRALLAIYPDTGMQAVKVLPEKPTPPPPAGGQTSLF